MIDGGGLAELPAPAWKVLSVLVFKYRQKDGTARPGQRALMADTGMCETQVRTALRSLRARGIVRELQRGRSARHKGDHGKAAVYEIPFPIDQRKITDHRGPLTGGKSTVGKPRDLPVENRPPTSHMVSLKTGVCKQTMIGGRKTTGQISVDDLVDPQRLASLFSRCVARGSVLECEADRLDFFASAERAIRIADDPPAMFAATILHWGDRRRFASIGDEEAARRKLNLLELVA
jgi:hypothetical protein